MEPYINTPQLEAPGIPGLKLRPFHGEADFSNIASVINASFAADRKRERISVDELVNMYTNPIHWNPKQDTLLAEVDERLVGYANTEWHTQKNGDCLHSICLHLVPAWRGCGLELAMQCNMENRARLVADDATCQKTHFFTSNAPETWQAYTHLLQSTGYTPVRTYLEMQRSLDKDLPEVVLPEGIAFLPATPEHFRLIWEAAEECFRDQADYVAPGEESYRAWIETPGLDASLWLVAWEGAQIAGGAINVIHEDAWGETDDLFVRRPWRKRGLGKALLAGCLHLFKERLLTNAGLGVDAENVSHALGLYERLGYRPYLRVIMYRKQI